MNDSEGFADDMPGNGPAFIGVNQTIIIINSQCWVKI